jgi:hypothetical protein
MEEQADLDWCHRQCRSLRQQKISGEYTSLSYQPLATKVDWRMLIGLKKHLRDSHEEGTTHYLILGNGLKSIDHIQEVGLVLCL